MARLTNTSKIIIIGFGLFLFILLGIGCFSCMNGCNRQQDYSREYDNLRRQNYNYYEHPPQQPQYQTVIRDDGSSFVMNYLLYKSLMDQGGPKMS